MYTGRYRSLEDWRVPTCLLSPLMRTPNVVSSGRRDHRFIEMARAAGAVYKIGTAKGNTILINLEIFDDYMEQFREPPTEMKHPLPNVKGD